MTMSCINLLLLTSCLLYLPCVNAQKKFTGYIAPQFSLNYKVSTFYSHNFLIGQRSYFYKNDALGISARQVDIAHFSNLKIKANQSIALGIQYRFRAPFEKEEENELRITEQYNYTFKPKTIRFGHRARLEQRIRPSLTTHRLRYRFAADMPLQGEVLDLGEAYFIASIESLCSVASTKKASYDQRFSLQIGTLLYQELKLQAGIEYRMEDYTEALQHVFFLNSALILSL